LPVTPKRSVQTITGFIATAGGVIRLEDEYYGGMQSPAVAAMVEKIRDNIAKVNEIIYANNESPPEAAFEPFTPRIRKSINVPGWH